MEPTDNGDLPVTINCNLAALRVLHKSVTQAYKNWPGGDPNEQVELEIIRDLTVEAMRQLALELKQTEQRATAAEAEAAARLRRADIAEARAREAEATLSAAAASTAPAPTPAVASGGSHPRKVRTVSAPREPRRPSPHTSPRLGASSGGSSPKSANGVGWTSVTSLEQASAQRAAPHVGNPRSTRAAVAMPLPPVLQRRRKKARARRVATSTSCRSC